MNKNKIVFLCGARDFHAMDWYSSAKEELNNENVIILTDLIESEGYKDLTVDNDNIYDLLIIDKILFKKQSRIGGVWRNIVKFLVLPIQVLLIKQFYKKNKNSIFHAHSMYYIWLAAFANVPFIGTPQGSDILVKPFSSKLYYYLSSFSLTKAIYITVDSEKMKQKAFEICGINPIIIQNGIDIKSINHFLNENINKVVEKNKVLSPRGLSPLYRIKELLLARFQSYDNLSRSFIYPFY